MITIDYLSKKCKQPPFYMGLGMVKIKMGGYAYRFYCHEVAKQFIDIIHTHTYGFESELIKGVLINVVYDVQPVEHETDYKLIELPCNATLNQEGKTLADNVEFTETIRFDTTVGHKYKMHPEVMHRIEHGSDKIITKITPYMRSTATTKYVIDKRFPMPDPWGEPKSEKECWEIVEHVLT